MCISLLSLRATPVASWCSGVPLVLEALLSSGALKTLDLGANGLTGAGVEALLAGLGACPLQTLEVTFVFCFCIKVLVVYILRRW